MTRPIQNKLKFFTYLLVGSFFTISLAQAGFTDFLNYQVNPMNWPKVQCLVHGTPKYQVRAMFPYFWLSDSAFGIKYFTKEELNQQKIEIGKDGLLYYSESNKANGEKRVVSTEGREVDFVMDKNGDIYIGHALPKSKRMYYRHSSFFRGQPVAVAGEMKIENGIIQTLNNRSGHYMVTPQQFSPVLKELIERGVMNLPQNVKIYEWKKGISIQGVYEVSPQGDLFQVQQDVIPYHVFE